MLERRGMLLPCLRGVVGDWIYYSTVMTAGQIATHVRPAGEIREAQALEDHLQRDLNKRSASIARYLMREPTRFFPAMVVGVFGGVPDWHAVDFLHSKIGGEVMVVDEAELLAETVGLLRTSGREQMFAIDGQHRAKAIEEAWSADKSRRSGAKVLVDDQFPVILVAHQDDVDGKRRSRRLFADINKRAVPVSAGDLAIIDEDDVAAIAARRIYAQYKPFADRISLTARANMDADDRTHIANLLTLVRVNKALRKLSRKVAKTRSSDEVNVANMYVVATGFYNFLLRSIRILNDCLVKKRVSIGTLRVKKRHLAARPVGLVLLARLYARYAAAKQTDVLRVKLGLLDMDLGGQHFNRVLWSSGKMEPKNQGFAYELCLYLFGEEVDEGDLRREYRRITKDDGASLPPPLEG